METSNQTGAEFETPVMRMLNELRGRKTDPLRASTENEH